MLEKAEYLAWMDSSVRLQVQSPLLDMFQRAKDRGYQTGHNGGSMAVRTAHSMASFYGDKLCQYAPFDEIAANMIFFYNDRLAMPLMLNIRSVLTTAVRGRNSSLVVCWARFSA